MKELDVEEEDEYEPDEDAIKTIHVSGDYGIAYITFTIFATIILLIVLSKVG